MLDRFKSFWTGVILAPVIALLIRLKVSPDVVTFVGTVGVAAGALGFYPRGELMWGTVFITCFVFSDIIDGAMARKVGRTKGASTFGGFWDSTLDRIGDGAIFMGLALYFAGPGDSTLYMVLSLVCLVMGSVTSYARAKAESIGLTAKVGIAERGDRLVSMLVMTGFAGLLDLIILCQITLWALAIASTITVIQRVWVVRVQALALDEHVDQPTE